MQGFLAVHQLTLETKQIAKRLGQFQLPVATNKPDAVLARSCLMLFQCVDVSLTVLGLVTWQQSSAHWMDIVQTYLGD